MSLKRASGREAKSDCTSQIERHARDGESEWEVGGKQDYLHAFITSGRTLASTSEHTISVGNTRVGFGSIAVAGAHLRRKVRTTGCVDTGSPCYNEFQASTMCGALPA